MKKIALLSVGFLFCLFSFSQNVNLEVISSAGGYFAPEGSEITLSWTLGEPVIETFAPNGSDIILTQGFQQPNEPSQPGKYTIDGYVWYDNTAKTPITNLKIVLLNSEKARIDSTTTSVDGHYIFNNVINGSYSFICITDKTNGGINPADALNTNRNYLGTYNFKDALVAQAADVANPVGVNPSDALAINRRYIGTITKFTRLADWIFENPTVIVSSANVTQNILSVCAGDVNASNVPPLKSIYKDVLLQNNGILLVNEGKEFNLPIVAANDLHLGAFGLIIKYPSKSLKVKEVVSEVPGMIFNIMENEVRIAWADDNISGFKFNKNIPIVNLKMVANNISKDKDIVLDLMPESILVDNVTNEIKREVLFAPKIAFETAGSGYYLGQNFPNPFRNNTQIEYSIPDYAFVTIKVFNLIGEQLNEIVNSNQQAGYHKASFYASGFAEGVYMYTMQVRTAKSDYTKTKMMIISQ